jgi:hypothetical protein
MINRRAFVGILVFLAAPRVGELLQRADQVLE